MSIFAPFRRVAGLSESGHAPGSHRQGMMSVFHLFPQGQDEGLLSLAGKGECGQDAEEPAAGVSLIYSALLPLPRLSRLSPSLSFLPSVASCRPFASLPRSPGLLSLPLLCFIPSPSSLFTRH